jgi:hypothetical protein
LGQTIGGALSSGAEAMQSGQTNAVQQMLLRQKLDEAKMASKRQADFDALLTGADGQGISGPAMPASMPAAMPAAMPAPSLNAAQGALTSGVQPTAATSPTPAAPMGLQQFLSTQPRAYLESLRGMSQADAMKSIQDRMSQSMTYGKPEFFVGQDGEPVAMQYNPFGEGRVVPGLRPSEPTPNEIKTLRELGLPVTLAGVMQLRQASAARQNVQVGGGRIGAIPPGFEAIEDPKTGAFRFVAIPGGPADIAAQEKSVAKDFAQANLERAGGTVVQDIGRVLKILGESGPLATGRGAVVGRLDPVSQASQIEDLVGSVRGNIGVDQLQQMRNASPTGGALGNVTERQLEGLQGLLGSLKVTGDKNILEDNLKRISNLYLDQIHGTPEQIRATGPARGLTPEQIEMLATREELSFDVRGNPIGAKKTEQKKSLDQIFKPK